MAVGAPRLATVTVVTIVTIVTAVTVVTILTVVTVVTILTVVTVVTVVAVVTVVTIVTHNDCAGTILNKALVTTKPGILQPCIQVHCTLHTAHCTLHTTLSPQYMLCVATPCGDSAPRSQPQVVC